jgi:acyl-CoA reductase-like NAD-dependent aldehyde dehydrogenase
LAIYTSLANKIMAVVGRFGNNGQTCIGAKRFIVVDPLKESFLEAFSQAAKGLKLALSISTMDNLKLSH